MSNLYIIDGRCKLNAPLPEFAEPGVQVGLMLNTPDKPFFNVDAHRRAAAVGASALWAACPHGGRNAEVVQSCNRIIKATLKTPQDNNASYKSCNRMNKDMFKAPQEHDVNYYSHYTYGQRGHGRLSMPMNTRYCEWMLPNVGGVLSLIFRAGFITLLDMVCIVGEDESIADKIGCDFINTRRVT